MVMLLDANCKIIRIFQHYIIITYSETGLCLGTETFYHLIDIKMKIRANMSTIVNYCYDKNKLYR